MLMCILSVYITYPSLFWIFAVYWLFSHKHSIHEYNGNSCGVKIGNIGRRCKKKKANGNKSSELSILLLSFNIFDNKLSREILIHIHVDSSSHHTHQTWFSDLSVSRVPGRAFDDSQDFLSNCHWHHSSRLSFELISLGCILELKSGEQYLFPSHLSNVTFRYKYRWKCCCC